jgi:hypothetical protein
MDAGIQPDGILVAQIHSGFLASGFSERAAAAACGIKRRQWEIESSWNIADGTAFDGLNIAPRVSE